MLSPRKAGSVTGGDGSCEACPARRCRRGERVTRLSYNPPYPDPPDQPRGGTSPGGSPRPLPVPRIRCPKGCLCAMRRRTPGGGHQPCTARCSRNSRILSAVIPGHLRPANAPGGGRRVRSSPGKRGRANAAHPPEQGSSRTGKPGRRIMRRRIATFISVKNN